MPYALHEDKGFSFSADEILDRVNDNTRLIILNSPGNPTGGSNLEAEVEESHRPIWGLEAFPNCAVDCRMRFIHGCISTAPAT